MVRVADGMKLGLRNACEVLATYLHVSKKHAYFFFFDLRFVPVLIAVLILRDAVLRVAVWALREDVRFFGFARRRFVT